MWAPSIAMAFYAEACGASRGAECSELPFDELERKPDDCGDIAVEKRDERIMIVLDAVSAGFSFPEVGVEVSLELSPREVEFAGRRCGSQTNMVAGHQADA